MGKMSVQRAPSFQKGERLTAEKMNLISEAINSLAAKIDRSPTLSAGRNPYCPPFQLDPYLEGEEWRIALTPGTVLGPDTAENIDRTLAIRSLLTFWTGTANAGGSAFSVTRESWPNPADCVLNQISGGGGANIYAQSNGYYLCAEYEFELTGCDESESYIGANAPYLALEWPSSFIYMRLVPVDDWSTEDNVTNSGTGTRRLGPLGFCAIESGTPNVVNYWNSDVTIPLIYRSRDQQAIVSTDANNDITAGTDGGAYYNAP